MTNKRFILDSDFVKVTSQVAWDNQEEKGLTLMKLVDLLNEQQATINLLLDLLYQSEATVINEYSSHIGEDMDKLDKIFKEKDIKEIERFVRGCDDE